MEESYPVIVGGVLGNADDSSREKTQYAGSVSMTEALTKLPSTGTPEASGMYNIMVFTCVLLASLIHPTFDRSSFLARAFSSINDIDDPIDRHPLEKR